MSVVNFMSIHPILVEIFQSGSKWSIHNKKVNARLDGPVETNSRECG